MIFLFILQTEFTGFTKLLKTSKMSLPNFSSGDPQDEKSRSFSPNYDSQNNLSENTTETTEQPVRKTFMQKVKEALRDWSAKDAEDQEYDDSRV